MARLGCASPQMLLALLYGAQRAQLTVRDLLTLRLDPFSGLDACMTRTTRPDSHVLGRASVDFNYLLLVA
jgi:hypothetical protein